jgi:hypothetical protein
MPRSLLVLLVAGPVLAAPDAKEKPKEPILYFPVKVGTTFVYEVRSGNSKMESVETVTKVEAKDGKYQVRVGSKGKSDTTDFEVSETGISRLLGDGKPPLLELKLPAKPGDTWTSEARGVGKLTCTVVKEEEVEVPAGKYKALAIAIKWDVTPDHTAKVKVWYAPEVGMVKKIHEEDILNLTVVLKSFTPGK